MNSPIFICIPESRGRYIRLERFRRGLRQVDIAEAANIPQSYVSAAERDKWVPWWVLEALKKTLDLFVEEVSDD